MRLIDGDTLEKFLSDAEMEATKRRKYVLASALNVIQGNVRNFPTIEPETNWISCKERLPEEEVDVLCCRNNKTIAIMHFNPVLTTRYPKGFSVVENNFSWRQDNVVAWMPLPERYREEGEEE